MNLIRSITNFIIKVIIQILCPKEAHEVEIVRAAYQRCKYLDFKTDLFTF